jgi:hypothetical protein
LNLLGRSASYTIKIATAWNSILRQGKNILLLKEIVGTLEFTITKLFMANLKNSVSICCLVVISGCASKSLPIGFFTQPEINTIATKGIGESLITQGQGVLEPALIVKTDKIIGKELLKKGRYEFEDQNRTRYKFFGKNQDIYLIKETKKICVDKEDNSHCADVEYKTDVKLSRTSLNSFQQTLLYNGRTGNRIAFGYREFSNNAARPAFNNDVTYDLDESKIIGYKGARIEIIKATNTEITYKFTSGFDKE